MTAPTIRRVCAWCRAVLDGGPPITKPDQVSHGICESCADGFLGDRDSDPDGDFTR